MTPKRPSQGFVLPSVLGYIAAFSLIVVLAAGALDRARSATIAIEAQNRLQSALDDVEAQALYAFLTSTPVEGGVALFRAPADDAAAIVLGERPADDRPAPAGPETQFWSAKGGAIQVRSGGVRARVYYRDTAGLVSLNSSDSAIVEALLQLWGVERERAATLTAQLKDYVDDDSVRRPRGGEAADYRLRQRPLPTNSPLRDIAEAQLVLDWVELDLLGRPEFIEQVTISLAAPEPRWVFSPDPVASIQENLSPDWTRELDPIAMASNAHSVPGPRARLTIMAYDEATGLGRMRIVEIERQSAGLAAPHSRVLVYEAGHPGLSLESEMPDDPMELNLFGDGTND